MSGIVIPFGAKVARFHELTDGAQKLLLNVIDYTFENGPASKLMTLEEFREGIIDLLESGEAYIEQVEGGLALKLVDKGSDWLI